MFQLIASLLLVLMLFNTWICPSVDGGESQSSTIDLIHRDSLLSPLYNPSVDSSKLIQNIILRSLRRVSLLNRSSTNIDGKGFEFDFIPNESNYLMKFKIGFPPVEVLAIFDTGSNALWLQCASCRVCYHQTAPPFNPMKSTFEHILYGEKICKDFGGTTPGFLGDCVYHCSYMDGTHSEGFLGHEKITFGDSTTPNPNSFEIVIGCGEENYARFSRLVQGVVGFGDGLFSLVSQVKTRINYKFSYCLIPFRNVGFSKLTLGQRSNKISKEGFISFPLVTIYPLKFYQVILKSVGIGVKKTTVGLRTKYIKIDSGTTLTMLPSMIYNGLEKIIIEKIEEINILPTPDRTKVFRLCYDKGSIKSISNLPKIDFHLNGGSLSLPPANTFLPYQSLYCLAIVPNDRISILGNMAQVNYVIEFDLLERQVSFARADCSILNKT